MQSLTVSAKHMSQPTHLEPQGHPFLPEIAPGEFQHFLAFQ